MATENGIRERGAAPNSTDANTANVEDYVFDGFHVGTISLEDAAHLRDLMYASLAEEANFLVQHAHDARSRNAGCAEDAEMAAANVRRTCALLDVIGWEAL